MLSKLRNYWRTVRESLWFLPAVLAVAAIVLAAITLAIDRDLIDGGRSHLLIFSGGGDGARGVLTAIASGIITVTGVVFSITIIALQLASTQFTPRVLRSFMSDRVNQLVLGVFIGTFTYTLLVLRTVISSTDEYEGFVPSLSVTVSVALALVSIGFLIFFIDHAAQSIQASHVIERVHRETRRQVDHLFPTGVGEAGKAAADAPGARADRDRATAPPRPELPNSAPAPVAVGHRGFIQGVDASALMRLASDRDIVVRMEPRLGDYVLPGEALASVWPAESLDAEIAGRIRQAFVLGRERTPVQDVERGIIELVDIALKALSPSINDPTTAMICIDRLADLLVVLGDREPPPRHRYDDDGALRLVLPRPDYDELATLALAQIRHFAAGQPAVIEHLLRMIGRMGALVVPARRAPLHGEAEAALAGARRAIQEPRDLARVEAAARIALDATTDVASSFKDSARTGRA